MAKLIKYGFIHDKAQANAFLKSSGIKSNPDAGDDCFYFQFDGPIEGEVCIDVEIDGHIYSMTGSLGPTAYGCYGSIGTSKDKTSFDFVDKQPVAEASEPWPTIKETATPATMTVSTFTGGIETYPSQLTQVMGNDDKPVKGVSLSLDTKNNIQTQIPTKEEIAVADHKEAAKKGCNFDAQTAKATHGKKVVLMVTPSDEYVAAHEGIFEDGVPIAVAGQNGLTFSVEAETSEAPTKDGDGEWIIQTAGQKSWTASTDGLWALDDDGRAMVVDALKNGTLVCVGAYIREKSGTDGVKLTPIRKGMAIVTSDEVEAPVDDNTTYSCEFTGTGELWMIESAAPEEIEAMTIDTGAE